jgi:trimeric autotransporter adhesin
LQGRLYIADSLNHRIRRIDENGVISTVVSAGNGFAGDGGSASLARISFPNSLAFDAAGNLFISDAYNARIRKVDLSGNIQTVANVTGLLDGGVFVYAVAVDSNNRVYFSDSTQLIRRIEADGSVVPIGGEVYANAGPAGSVRLQDARAIARTQDRLFIAAGANGTVHQLFNGAIDQVIGRHSITAARGALARFRDYRFGAVTGVVWDDAVKKLYISESGSSHRIVAVTLVDANNPDSWTIETLVNNTGVPGFTNGPAANAQLREPAGLWLDKTARQLYVADSGNHSIRVVDLEARVVSTIVNSSRRRGFSGDGGAAQLASLQAPAAVTKCGNGDLFIADTANHRVRRVDGNGVITTVIGDGVAASSGQGLPATSFPIDTPRGLACDSFGNLFVSSGRAVRMLPAKDDGVVDGTGAVQTIFGAPPRDTYPASETSCLTAISVNGDVVEAADACSGLVFALARR